MTDSNERLIPPTHEQIASEIVEFAADVEAWRDANNFSVPDGKAIDRFLAETNKLRLRLKRIALDGLRAAAADELKAATSRKKQTA